MVEDLTLFNSGNHDMQITDSELSSVNNLKIVFRDIRDYFAGNVTGITRDEKIAENIMRLLFCKIYDEKNSNGKSYFINEQGEELKVFSSKISSLFEKVKSEYSDIFSPNEKIEIADESLSYIVSKLENYSLLDAERDVIGDAFEEFIGTAFRGGEGQFFTPRNVVEMIINFLDPQDGEKIIDPACGSGGFLAHALRHLMSNGKKNYSIMGIDKDLFLSKIAKIYLSIIGNAHFSVHCENSLDTTDMWKKETNDDIQLGTFDIIMTNPPFGAKIPVIGEKLLSSYELGYKWQYKNQMWNKTNRLLDKQPPQVLFIERCIQLLKPGGRLGIVLPEGIFGNPSDKYIWEYISSVASITGIVSLPQETFQPSTHTKTSVLFLEKKKSESKDIFMAISENIGHNKNGKPTYKVDSNGKHLLNDDLPEIFKNFSSSNEKLTNKKSHLGFFTKTKEISDHIYIPEYYNPEIKKEIQELNLDSQYQLLSIGELIDRKIIEMKRGNEIGSQFYGTGKIPFIRTSDLVNWEIKFNPIKTVSEVVYEKYKKPQDIQESDILFVSDGTFLIGRSAMITDLDLKIIIQSHLKKIRVLDKNFIDPYYFFYLLNSKIVQKQIASKTFVQATISTLGNRFKEVVIPISNDEEEVKTIIKKVRSIIKGKAILRKETVDIINGSV